jgi:Peptidase A4 family
MTSNSPTSARPGHRRRIVLTAVVLTALAAVFALVLSALLGAGRPSWSFGPFAGYTWHGHVTSVSASWTVPSVTEGSRCAVASTWIGAAALDNSRSFVQIGTDERRCFVSNENQVSDTYSAFWTDFAHDLEPQTLFPVNAGDDQKASLAIARGRWTLTMTDTTTGAHARFAISTPGDAAINQAAWTQEDDTNSTLHDLYPYPHLTTVGFQDLEINSRAPAYPDLYSSWMSVGSTDLAPTPLYHDSFTIIQATVSTYGAQYLHIAKPEDTATEAFIAQLATWTADTPRSQIDTVRSRYAIALRDNISAFTAARWPAETQDLVDSLTGKTRLLLDQTQSPIPAPSAGTAIWRSIWTRDANAVGSAAHTLKRKLDLPETRPIPRY